MSLSRINPSYNTLSSDNRINFINEAFLTYGKAADALGVSRMTLWKWIKSGKIEAHRIGREVLIEKAVVEKLKR